MARTLEDLITEANAAFQGNHVWTQYQLQAPTKAPVQLLAQYLVAEMHDLYSLESDDSANLLRLISNLEFASARLENVTRCLRELHKASLPTRYALAN